MGFHTTRDDNGVTVVRVEGQLIVGNRQELKDLIGTRWTRRAQVP